MVTCGLVAWLVLGFAECVVLIAELVCLGCYLYSVNSVVTRVFWFLFWGFCGLLFVGCSLICCFFCG